MYSNIKILIIEDEGIIGMDLKDYLEHSGFTVLGPLITYDSAINFLSSNKTDLNIVLIDYRLKNTIDGGLGIAKYIIHNLKNTKFIFTTGHTDICSVNEMKRFNVPILSKPYNYDLLKQEILNQIK